MVMISMPGGEARATPSYHSMGSPRYGGCVGALLHFFDWSPGKCFYSTKRLPASKLEGRMRRSRSFRSDHGSTARTRMMCDARDAVQAEEGSAHVGTSETLGHGDDASARAPGVVARLMGLESLPKSPYQPTARHRRCQSYSGSELPLVLMGMDHHPQNIDLDVSGKQPVLLQDLLERDFKAASKKLTLRERMPGFAKRAQEQYESKFTKRGAASYMDMIPDTMQTQKLPKLGKQPFLSRLAPASSSLPPSKLHTPHDSPSETASIDGIRDVPKLSLQAAGWPLTAAEPLDLSESSGSRPAASTKSSKPALANVARKIFQGRRRAGAGNESEDSESNSSQVEILADDHLLPIARALQQRKKLARKELSALKKVVKSLSPPRHRNTRITKSSAGAHHHHHHHHHETTSVKSGTRIAVTPKAAAQNVRTSSSKSVKAILSSSSKDVAQAADQARQPLIPSRITRSTDHSFQTTSDHQSAAQDHHHNPRTSSSASSTGSQTLPPPIVSSKPSTGAKFARKLKSDAANSTTKVTVSLKPPPLDGYRAPKLVRDGQKTGTSSMPNGSLIPGYGKVLGARKADKAAVKKAHKKGGESCHEMAAPRFISDKAAKINTLQGIQRVRETMQLANSTAITPLAHDRLKQGDEMATPRVPDQQAITVEGGTDRGYSRKNGMISKHAILARSIDEVFPELPLELNSFSSYPGCDVTDIPRGDCDEVVTPVPVNSCELLVADEQVFHVDLQEFFAADRDQADDELSWEEDETVEQRVNSPDLSAGRFCERSCSGPSISSVSVVSDVDDERNGDDWSSCASYNPADCDSPRTFELPDTDADESDLHEQKSTPMMFVKKIAQDQSDAATTEVDELLAAGQPSPVSILNSPFHDEAGTISSEYALHSDFEEGFKSSSTRNNNMGHELSASNSPSRSSRTSNTTKPYDSDNDKIRQALLDISMFQCLEVFTFDYKDQRLDSNRNTNSSSSATGPQEEERFVRDILSAASFMSTTPGSSPNWFDQDVVIDPSLFDRLEMSGDIEEEEEDRDGVESLKMMFQMSWRCDRKLLFDCVNEAFAFTLWRSWCSEMGVQWCCASRPRGQKLVEEVYKRIEEWRKVAALSIDCLIERDMGSLECCGNWKSFSVEVEEVGMDIESLVWKAIVEEVVMDMVATSSKLTVV